MSNRRRVAKALTESEKARARNLYLNCPEIRLDDIARRFGCCAKTILELIPPERRRGQRGRA